MKYEGSRSATFGMLKINKVGKIIQFTASFVSGYEDIYIM
jgi:hypothetical protein